MHRWKTCIQFGRLDDHRTSHSFATAIAMLFVSIAWGCTESAIAPLPNQPAQLVLGASFQTTTAENEAIIIRTEYLLKAGSTKPLSTETIVLDGTNQRVPVSINLAQCLADKERLGFGETGVAADECRVMIEIRLMLDGAQVDRQIIGPLTLRPGLVATVPEAIQLNDISGISIKVPPENSIGAGEPLRLEMQKTMVLAASVIDRQQNPVSGRTVQWTSSNNTVATVNTAGVVTPISVGTVRITAEVGGHATTVDVRVVPAPALLVVTSSGVTGSGRIISSPFGVTCNVAGSTTSGACLSLFPGDVNVTLSVSADGASEFLAWGGDCSSATGDTCTLSMDRPRSVSAAFRALRSLSVSMLGGGSGMVSVAGTGGAAGIECTSIAGIASGTCTGNFREGSIVALTAVASSGSIFSGWTGDCAETEVPVCHVTMSGARSVAARFEVLVPITVIGSGSGSGMVESIPRGVSCSIVGQLATGDCSSQFAKGSTVKLIANAAAENGFMAWTGCTQSTGSTCTVVVGSNTTTVSARFAPPSLLTVAPSGNGNGEVSGAGISCMRLDYVNSGTCSRTFAGASVVVLTAAAGSNSMFVGWTGVCIGGGSCIVTMDQAKTVGAIFSYNRVSLSLTLLGPGSGKVQVDNGASCVLKRNEGPKNCSFEVDRGSSVTLTATPDSGQQFNAFSGACVSDSSKCTFAVTGPTSVTASFDSPKLTVRVGAESGTNGSGYVYLGELDMACRIQAGKLPEPLRCSSSIDQRDAPSSLRFTAEPDLLTNFSSWGGACASFGTSPVCIVSNPRGAIDVLASFVQTPTVSVTVYIVGEAGTATASGEGWSRTCTRSSSVAPTTVCVWSVPVGMPFQVNTGESFVTEWSSNSGELCYGNSGTTCDVSSGVAAARVLRMRFWYDGL